MAWTVWFGLGAERAWAWIEPKLSGAIARRSRSTGPQALALGAIGAAGIAAWSLPTPVDLRVYAPMRAWATETSAAEPGARLLASDIGAIGWWWKGTVLDTDGLVWPAALRHGGPSGIIEAEGPEYVMIVAERARLLEFQERPDLFSAYVAIARFSDKGETSLTPSPGELPPRWSQDYIVYKRRSR